MKKKLRFQNYDYFLIIIYVILMIDIILNWSQYSSCEYPINIWLVISFTSMILTRIIFVIDISDISESTSLHCKILLFIIFIPGTAYLCVQGFISMKSNSVCIPKARLPWSIYLWIILLFITLIGLLSYLGLVIKNHFNYKSILRKKLLTESSRNNMLLSNY